MIKLLLISGTIILSCGSAKKNQAAGNTDSLKTPGTVNRSAKDSPAAQLNADTTPVKNKSTAALPACIKNKIDSFKTAQKHEQPQRVTEYTYKGKKVYYVVMPCCDFFNEVYDEKCNLLGAPDGGFTGQGDGKLPGFFKEAKNEKLVWEAATR